ncbi:MAG: hypothetical protein JXR31_16810, partial [Prolixibacteraceae bacterium]|nr:hypothetical protein [Prolixibacteraceae bacterium]
HVSPAELARQLNTNPSAVHGMLNRPTIQVQKLIKLSEVLKYNFFREIAQKLPFKDPEVNKPDDEKQLLKERIKELEIEATTLRRTLKDIIRG